MTPDQFLARMKKGALAPAYLFLGAEAYNRDRCRKALLASLDAAAKVPATTVYSGDPLCKDGDQWCYDAIRQRPIGGATQPLIAWINRPTFQQAVEIQGHR